MKQIDLAWLVDDDKVYAYVITKQLKQIGCCDRFEIFGNGKEALDALRAKGNDPDNLPSLILLDLNMPVMDGWQFLDVFCGLSFSKRITIYIVSSSIDPYDHARIDNYNCVSNFLIKPIKRDELKKIFDEVAE